MDIIAETIIKHGNVWTLTANSDLQELYEPLQAARVSLLLGKVICEKGITYGPHKRHRLDVRVSPSIILAVRS